MKLQDEKNLEYNYYEMHYDLKTVIKIHWSNQNKIKYLDQRK